MRIAYCLIFEPSQTSGKELGAFCKLAEFREIFSEVYVLSVKKNQLWRQFLSYLINEFHLFLLFCIGRLDFAICRGNTGILSSLFFKDYIIREIHSDIDDELEILNKTSVKYRLLSVLNNICERRSRAHVYNNPKLLEHYKKVKIYSGKQTVIYNGGKCICKESTSIDNLTENFINNLGRYIVFTGSCSVWHDMKSVEVLASRLEGYDIKVLVCGGRYDSNCSNLINLSPATRDLSIYAIKNSIGAVLFINDLRVSPGNALKLYEYMEYGKFIICNRDLIGYSDELQFYSGGYLINVNDYNIENLVCEILNSQLKTHAFPPNFTWRSRSLRWYEYLKSLR